MVTGRVDAEHDDLDSYTSKASKICNLVTIGSHKAHCRNNGPECFVYTASKAGATINRYIGSSALVEIPGKINGTTVTALGKAAFAQCESVVTVNIPSTVKTIDDDVFMGCVSLQSVSLPSGLKSIGNEVFEGCEKLTRLTLPKSVVSIQEEAFNRCFGLTWIDVEQGSPNFKSIDGVLFNKPATTLVAYPSGRPGSYAIPSTVKTIGNTAFGWCTQLTSVSIPSSVTKILKNAFGGCTALTSVTLPRGVDIIEEGPFRYCNNLVGIIVDQNNPKFRSIDGVLFNKAVTTVVSYSPAKPGGYILPSTVKTIAGEAFMGCEKLTSLSIPSGVTTIGDQAFSGCSALTSVAIPNGVKTIGEQMFSWCMSLTSVSIPASVTFIDEGAFAYCQMLESLTIPERVTTIEDDAFVGCTGLSVITIPSSVKNIGSSVFEGCDYLTEIRFKGAPPRLDSEFGLDREQCKVYRLPTSRGWRATYGGLDTAVKAF